MPDQAIQIRKQRWREFYDPTSPCRLVFLVRYAPDMPVRPLPNPERKLERIEWIWQNYTYLLRQFRAAVELRPIS